MTASCSRAASPSRAPAATRGAGRPKDPGKRAAILEAAKAMFPRLGYEGVSMDAIAAEAGVSKLTVYSHFSDKETLFAEAIRAKVEEVLPPSLFMPDLRGGVRRQLSDIARAFFAMVTSEDALVVHRLMSSQALPPDSKLPALFWEIGPQRTHEVFARFLNGHIAAGDLDIPDVERAASQFFCLLKGELHARMLCGCTEPLAPAEVDAHLEATVELFLRAYGRRGEA